MEITDSIWVTQHPFPVSGLQWVLTLAFCGLACWAWGTLPRVTHATQSLALNPACLKPQKGNPVPRLTGLGARLHPVYAESTRMPRGRPHFAGSEMESQKQQVPVLSTQQGSDSGLAISYGWSGLELGTTACAGGRQTTQGPTPTGNLP